MKIMVCYDGSKPSKKAFRLAKDHASAFDGSIIIVSSMTKGTDADKKDIEKVEQELRAMKKEFINEEYSCETHLLIRGLTAGEDLVQFAEEKKINEIIIGVKRRSRVGKLVFGSTAQFVILRAHCPIVAVK